MKQPDQEPHEMYAELHVLSNFSFLRGASMPQELVERAAQLNYAALALTDECSVAGAVRAHTAAKKKNLKFIVASEFRIDGLTVILLAQNRHGYGNLCRLITRGRRAADKGKYHLTDEDFIHIEDCLALLLPESGVQEGRVRWFAERFTGRAWLAVELLYEGDDRAKLTEFTALGARLNIPLVATGGVRMHVRERRVLHDTVTAIRLNKQIDDAGYELQASGERHLRSMETLRKIYPAALLAETQVIAQRCQFSLDELRYEYPQELVPAGHTPASWLRQLTEEGVCKHWPQGESAKVRELIEKELTLIHELQYESFFLTVHELVQFANESSILCQGRGSAANSVVCYCLGVTAVNPEQQAVLFERFLSRERDEPPDIDVDFEHDRREEVIQHIYEKYGRHRAALAATVIFYRGRSALRDARKALGPGREALVKTVAAQLMHCPRHLSQHVGGFVISRGPLEELVPIENASMKDRTVIQWDKDDLESLGLLKVDVLALGMLSALRRAFDLYQQIYGKELTLDSLPKEDPKVYEMISLADTVGVFQIESRAQMSMLPRLKPKKFYDLVVQIAIVRPGPIQGDMVHPYLRRRDGLEEVEYPSDAVKEVLDRTLGVPIFQEQVMQLAVVAAGFSAGEADHLRRSMAAWERRGTLEPFRQRLLDGMRERGYTSEFAERIFRQIQGFGEYGFPESHSCSFALLAYASSWIKCYEPAIFTAALLNSQPMGFYGPSQLIRDVRTERKERKGVEVRPVSVLHSGYDCTLETDTMLDSASPTISPPASNHSSASASSSNPLSNKQPALRLGLCLIKGLSKSGAERLVAVRQSRPVGSPPWNVHDLARQAQLNRRDMKALANAGALVEVAGGRRQALWQVAGIEPVVPLLQLAPPDEGTPLLRPPTEAQNVRMDYASLSFTLGRHPMAFLRPGFKARRVLSAAEVRALPHNSWMRGAGLVIGRQRPQTASGVTFVTLEDETGHLNLIVRKALADSHLQVFLESELMEVHGKVQRVGEVIHILAVRLFDHTHRLGVLTIHSRDFH